MNNRNIIQILMVFIIVIGIPICLSAQEYHTEWTEAPYGTDKWNADSLGNHRAIVDVDHADDAVFLHIPWRRRDAHPDRKKIIIISARTNEIVTNLFLAHSDREYADIVFQPVSGIGRYYIYYMPYRLKGSRNYPTAEYLKPDYLPDSRWLNANRLDTPNIKMDSFKKADLIAFESVDTFNSFYPMEIIATAAETERLIERSGSAYLLLTEDRRYPVRMKHDLPYKWIVDYPGKRFTGTAAKKEYYAYQIGLFAAKADVKNVKIIFSDLKNPETGKSISAETMTCINTEGINWDGKPFTKDCSVPKGEIQPFWCCVPVPENLPAGTYEGTVTVEPENILAQKIRIALTVTGEFLADRGDSQPWRHSRLRWLNSRIGFDDEPVAPFTPVTAAGNTVSILGRKMSIQPNGLPEKITSYFTQEMTSVGKKPYEILSGPVTFTVERVSGIPVNFTFDKPAFTKKSDGIVQWKTRGAADNMDVSVMGSLECDGYAQFQVKLTAKNGVDLNDISLNVSYTGYAGKYMLGLGRKGGYLPDALTWKWDVKKHQEGAWLGNVNAGMQFVLRNERYSRPLNTNFYQSKPLVLPDSWYNGGNGGINILRENETVQVTAYSGKRTMKEGETLFFNFNLLISPFKPLNTKGHWQNRYYHRFTPVDSIVNTGATVVNVHHANNANPYINYPFINTKEMKAYIDEAHANGLKVKIYNTIRELSNHALELFAIRSLGTEIFTGGPGGGYSWLQEHIAENYIAAWFVPDLKDAAIINSGMSRWHNYYVEGLNWLAKNIGIDGLYIDDIAFDRTTMKRVRKVLDRNRDGILIDLHSANQFNPRDGFINSAMLYMEHFPYLNRLWFGEYFDYDSPPDFWMTEVSGIPFGLMGEMLQNGGNKWRGMLFGMTARLPWAGDPAPVWKLWDDFGIAESDMYGFWSENCPVKTGRDDILATVYKRDGTALISLGSWAENDTQCRLEIDYGKLGIDKSRAVLTVPFIKDFQEEAEFDPAGPVPVPAGKGWLLIIREK